MIIRGVLIGLGALLIMVGALSMIDPVNRGSAPLPRVLTWLLAGPLLVDLVILPVVVLIGVLVHRWLPIVLRPAVAAGLAGTVLITLLAWPFVGGFGQNPGNPTTLNRDYLLGYVVTIALIWAVALIGGLTRWVRALGSRSALARQD